MRKQKNVCAILCWGLMTRFLFAQNSFVITVLSTDDQQPVAGAVISLKSISDSSQYKQQIFFTDEKGKTILPSTFPSQINIQCIGFRPFTDTISSAESQTFHLEKLLIGLNEVVVTGQYDINTSDKSVSNVVVIHKQEIQKIGAQNLSDVLSNQLNCRISEDNILGSSITLNGISGQSIKILVDGVPLIGRENGNIDLTQINMSNVERIEIVEGPMSASYGTDALGGLINIITKKSSSYTWEGDVNLYYESLASYNADAALHWRHNVHSVSLSGGRYFFAGFDPVDTSRYQLWKPQLQYFGALQYNLRLARWNFSSSSNYTNQIIQNKGVPVFSPYAIYAFDDYYLTRRASESTVAEWNINPASTFQFINSYSWYERVKNSYRKDLVSLQEQLLSAEGVQDTTVFDALMFRGTFNRHLQISKLNYQVGYDLNLESGRGEKLVSGIQHIGDYALFGSTEWKPVEKLTIRPGIRASYNTRYGAPVTPSLNLKFDFTKQLSLRAAYARGFRAPSLKELDIYFIDPNHNIRGNDSLMAETSNNFQLNLSETFLIAKTQARISASCFYNNIFNIITLALVEPTTQLYQYINLDRYKTTGGSIIAEAWSQRFIFSSGFSLLGLYNSLSDSFSMNEFSFSPEWQTGLTMMFPKQNFDGSINYRGVGKTPGYALDQNNALYQTQIDAYSLFDISATKYFLDKRIIITAGANNLFDVMNIQSSAVNGGFHSSDSEKVPLARGRYFFATVKLKWFKE